MLDSMYVKHCYVIYHLLYDIHFLNRMYVQQFYDLSFSLLIHLFIEGRYYNGFP